MDNRIKGDSYYLVELREDSQMKKHFLFGLLACFAMLTSSANADLLLNVELDTTDESITISATNGLSDIDASGSNFTGFYLADFYNTTLSGGVSETLLAGDLTSAENPTDNSPDLFRGFTALGLNVFSFTTDGTATFTAGEVAFSGSATWNVTGTGDFAEMLTGNSAGDVYFPADGDGDIVGLTPLGTYSVSIVPEPSSFAIVALGLGFIAKRRRR